jgi:hypothetical protein
MLLLLRPSNCMGSASCPPCFFLSLSVVAESNLPPLFNSAVVYARQRRESVKLNSHWQFPDWATPNQSDNPRRPA